MTGAGRCRGVNRRHRRTGRVVTAAVVGVLAVGGGAAAATGLVRPDGKGATRARTALPPATAQVTRQTLVDTRTEAGTLGYGSTTTVRGRLDGTVTALPAIGTTVARGQGLYWVDNAPVVLLYGGLPAYRELSPGTKGADVKQFEENLWALGYRGFTVDDAYTASTGTAVKKWQGDLGLPKTGTVQLGRVVYAADPVRVDTHEAAVGDAQQPGGAVLTYTGTSRVVTVELDVARQHLAKKDGTVTLRLPDGRTVPGKITKTRTVIDLGTGDSGGGNGSSDPKTKIEVSVTVDDEKAFAGLDDASIDVVFTASERRDVLTVPVAALLALAEGGYGVQVVDGDAARIVAVQTGLFAGGRVEVSGDGLAEGATVGMPS